MFRGGARGGEMARAAPTSECESFDKSLIERSVSNVVTVEV